MDPIFFYFDGLVFDNKIRFTLTFTNDEEPYETNYILLPSKKDYYITSMKCYLEIVGKIEDLSNYDKIKETSEISNVIIENSFDLLYKFNMVEYIIDTRNYVNEKHKFKVDKTNRKNHTRNFRFHDLETNQEKTIKVYSAFDELKDSDLKFKHNTLEVYNISLTSDAKNYKSDLIGNLEKPLTSIPIIMI